MLKKVVLIVICFALVTPSVVLAYDGTVSIKPIDKSVMLDSEVKIDLRVSDFKSIYSLSFEVTYESRILKYSSLEWGVLIKTDPEPVHIFSTKAGRITIALSYTDQKTNLKETGTVCTIKFKTLASAKTTPLTLEKLVGRRMNFDEVSLKGENSSIEVIAPPTKPIVTVDPGQLDFGTLHKGENKTLKVHVANTGKPGMKCSAEPQNNWITADPTRFETDEQDVDLTVTPTEDMVTNMAYNGRISFLASGGDSEDVVCRFYLQDAIPIDDLTPDLTIEEPTDGSMVNTSMIKIKGRTNPGVLLFINGAPREIASDGSFIHDLMLHEGLNEIKVLARKSTGKENEKIVKITLDTIKPIIQISPLPEIVHDVQLCINGVTEPGAIIKTGDKPVAANSNGAFSVCLALKPGENSLYLVVVDAAGNATEWNKKIQFVAQEIILISMKIGDPVAVVNGNAIYLDAPPAIKNGTTFVPMRFVSENLKATVNWDQATRSAQVFGKDHNCTVFIGSDVAMFDGKPVKLLAAPFLFNGRTMIPLRFIAKDTLGAELGWNEKEKKIDIKLIINLTTP